MYPGGEIRGHVMGGNSGFAILEGANEIPSVTTTGKGTVAMMYVENGRSLWFSLTVNGLSGAVTGAHFHGPAGLNGSAGVQFAIPGFHPRASTTGIWRGVTPQQAEMLASGQMYVNIHTAAKPSGEIRGQVMGLQVPPPMVNAYASLSGSAELPPTSSMGSGTGIFELDTKAGTLMYSLVCSGLSGPITKAHIHSGAAGVAGPMLFDLTGGIGANGMTVNGKLENVTSEQMKNLGERQLYFNVRDTVLWLFVVTPVLYFGSGWHVMSLLSSPLHGSHSGAPLQLRSPACSTSLVDNTLIPINNTHPRGLVLVFGLRRSTRRCLLAARFAGRSSPMT